MARRTRRATRRTKVSEKEKQEATSAASSTAGSANNSDEEEDEKEEEETGTETKPMRRSRRTRKPTSKALETKGPVASKRGGAKKDTTSKESEDDEGDNDEETSGDGKDGKDDGSESEKELHKNEEDQKSDEEKSKSGGEDSSNKITSNQEEENEDKESETEEPPVKKARGRRGAVATKKIASKAKTKPQGRMTRRRSRVQSGGEDEQSSKKAPTTRRGKRAAAKASEDESLASSKEPAKKSRRTRRSHGKQAADNKHAIESSVEDDATSDEDADSGDVENADSSDEKFEPKNKKEESIEDKDTKEKSSKDNGISDKAEENKGEESKESVTTERRSRDRKNQEEKTKKSPGTNKEGTKDSERGARATSKSTQSTRGRSKKEEESSAAESEKTDDDDTKSSESKGSISRKKSSGRRKLQSQVEEKEAPVDDDEKCGGDGNNVSDSEDSDRKKKVGGGRETRSRAKDDSNKDKEAFDVNAEKSVNKEETEADKNSESKTSTEPDKDVDTKQGTPETKADKKNEDSTIEVHGKAKEEPVEEKESGEEEPKEQEIDKPEPSKTKAKLDAQGSKDAADEGREPAQSNEEEKTARQSKEPENSASLIVRSAKEEEGDNKIEDSDRPVVVGNEKAKERGLEPEADRAGVEENVEPRGSAEALATEDGQKDSVLAKKVEDREEEKVEADKGSSGEEGKMTIDDTNQRPDEAAVGLRAEEPDGSNDTVDVADELPFEKKEDSMPKTSSKVDPPADPPAFGNRAIEPPAKSSMPKTDTEEVISDKPGMKEVPPVKTPPEDRRGDDLHTNEEAMFGLTSEKQQAEGVSSGKEAEQGTMERREKGKDTPYERKQDADGAVVPGEVGKESNPEAEQKEEKEPSVQEVETSPHASLPLSINKEGLHKTPRDEALDEVERKDKPEGSTEAVAVEIPKEDSAGDILKGHSKEDEKAEYNDHDGDSFHAPQEEEEEYHGEGLEHKQKEGQTAFKAEVTSKTDTDNKAHDLPSIVPRDMTAKDDDMEIELDDSAENQPGTESKLDTKPDTKDTLLHKSKPLEEASKEAESSKTSTMKQADDAALEPPIASTSEGKLKVDLREEVETPLKNDVESPQRAEKSNMAEVSLHTERVEPPISTSYEKEPSQAVQSITSLDDTEQVQKKQHVDEPEGELGELIPEGQPVVTEPPKVLYTPKRCNLDNIKMMLFSTGSQAHRGRGFEKIFSEYWDALSQIVAGNPSDSDLTRLRGVVKSFLRTKKLKKLHNRLVMGKACS